MPEMIGRMDGIWPFGPFLFPVFAALIVVPLANLILLYVFAFSAWPSLERKSGG
jgi:hypothetical protein